MKTLLIANRGEIACRIVRTARRMGIATVAVYSDADAGALHVRMADRAVRIGPAPAARSYLDAAAIVDAARNSGADAVHPGYGFLSENSDFAEGCAAAGLVFVGPPPAAIRAMGDKSRARALMRAAGVPVVPGHDGEDQSPAALAAAAEAVGYPLLVKAAAGGGGRGMRAVADSAGLTAALESARREAESAFGDGRLLLERLVAQARHVEVQVFGDGHGNLVHLGERDCSAQRRHQKIVEETPSPFVNDGLRNRLCADAILAARAVGYVGAGTVEFVVGADGGHFFLEMNTRLQVEHPVTEMVTGLDLVEWQIRVARGERLPLAQEEIASCGHAIEARLYAEDPADGFRPQAGRVLGWRAEGAGAADRHRGPLPGEEGVRVDAGVEEGDEVTPHYDPMIAKVVAHGADRAEAIARLRRALLARPLFGLATNRRFLIDLLGTDAFAAGAMTTSFVDGEVAAGSALVARPAPGAEAFALAAALLALLPGGSWFRSTGIAECPVTLECDGETREALVRFERGRMTEVLVDGAVSPIAQVAVSDGVARWLSGGAPRRAAFLHDGRALWLDCDGSTVCFREPDLLAGREPASDPSRIVSPVSGLVRALAVAVGDRVAAGAPVATIEAMKMETVIVARSAGIVSALRVAAGQQIRAGDLVAELAVDG